ncbi:MAG: ABC transporter substrate-binding protein [Methylovirgula sp.]|uniref:ABC transporter substrate-binding protein n=1 Tax=Methylovirgula sp. TaxID=1978224 RepID=UPI003076330A
MSKSLSACAIAIGLLFAGLDSASSANAPLEKLTVNVFPGGFNWPLFVARDKGFFTQQGLEVAAQPTTGSVAQMSGLASGKFDIAMTAVDNIVAYVEGEGDKSVGKQPDFFGFMGSDSGFLSLVSVPEIKSIGELRGKTLLVDARSTGYAFVLYDMLRRAGFKRTDYRVVPAGGMVQRWAAMQKNSGAATLLSTPFDILAKDKGFHQLSWATQVIGPYQGNVAATKRAWATAHRQEVLGYIRAYAAAIDWLYKPGNRDEAIRILRTNLPNMPEKLAEQTYGELLDPKAGFFRNARVNMDGLQTVLRLRSTYGSGPKLDDPSRYYDASYWADAMKALAK